LFARVKRWLTLANKEDQKAQNTKEQVKEDDKAKPSKENASPWWTTSSLATRLLEPQVSPVELKEYKR
jgi:hypothetical protein